MAVHSSRAAESHQQDFLFLARLKSDCRSRRDIQPHSVSGAAIKFQRAG